WEALVCVGDEVARDTGYTPLHVAQRLSAHVAALHPITQVVQRALEEGLRGCQLIAPLVPLLSHGDELTRTTASRLLLHVQQPLWSQLAQLLAFADVHDAHEEFFVAPAPAVSATTDSGAVAGAADIIIPSASATSLTLRSDVEQQAVFTAVEHALNERAWQRAWLLRQHMVPVSILPAWLAERVVAMASAVRTLITASSAEDTIRAEFGMEAADSDESEGEEEGEAFGDDVRAPHGDPATAGAARAPSTPRSSRSALRVGATSASVSGAPSVGARSATAATAATAAAAAESPDTAADAPRSKRVRGFLSRTDSLYIARLVWSLRGTPHTSLLCIESVLERIQSVVFSRLAVLLTKRTAAAQHLRALRDMHLLGRGDLFRAFIEAAGPQWASVPAWQAGAAAQLSAGPWRAAASLVGITTQAAVYQSASHVLMSTGSGDALALHEASTSEGASGECMLDRVRLQLTPRGMKWSATAAGSMLASSRVSGKASTNRTSTSIASGAAPLDVSDAASAITSASTTEAGGGGSRSTRGAARGAGGVLAGWRAAAKRWAPAIAEPADELVHEPRGE
ncbi:hypothetical protein EON68_01685, partial [archaeon]